MRKLPLSTCFFIYLFFSPTSYSANVDSKHFGNYQAAYSACKSKMSGLSYWGTSGSTYACNAGIWAGSPRLSTGWYCEKGKGDERTGLYSGCLSGAQETIQYSFSCPSPSKFNSQSQACIVECPENKPMYDSELGVCFPQLNKKENESCPVLDPIYPSTGESFQPQKAVFLGAGLFPLKLAFNYKSYRAPQILHITPKPSLPAGTPTKHYVGYKEAPKSYPFVAYPTIDGSGTTSIGYLQWRHSYQQSLFTKSDSSKVILIRADGDEIYFNVENDNITYKPNNLTGDKVIKSGSAWIYTDANGIIETYNSEGKLTQITNQQGLHKNLVYNVDGLLETVTDPAGRQLTFNYDTEKRLSTLTTPDNKVTTYQYGANGNLTQIIHPDDTPESLTDNPKTQYAYDDARHPYALTSQIDANGDTYATWTYDETGKALGSSNYGGHRDGSIAYDEGKITVTEASGHERTLTFNSKGLLSSVTGDNCGQCGSSDVASYGYDSQNQLTSEIDFNGNETRYLYNTRGLQKTRTEAYGTMLSHVTTTEWHSDLSLPTKVTTPTQQVDYVYGVQGRLESITEKDLLITENPTRVTTYTYNTTGLLESINGPRSDVIDVTTFVYDDKHDLSSITDAAGNVVQITQRNVNGYPVTIVDANGVTTTLTYDVRNRLISQTVAGHVTKFKYDNIGQLTEIKLPSGAISTYEYNGARLLTKILDGQGNSINYGYDVMGNVTNIDVKDSTDTLHATQVQVFDGLNRLTKQIDGLNQTTDFGYDAVGNQESVKTPLLKETKQVYDALNRLSETTDAKLGKTSYDYDTANNLTLVKAANGAQTTYSYDGFGNLLTQTSPDTGKTLFTYDIAGNQVSKTDAKGITIVYSYDALNRLTAIEYPTTHSGAALNISLAYDIGINGKGRLSQITDGSGSTFYSYNKLGLVSNKISYITGKRFSLKYSYNGAGQLTKMTLPSGRILDFTRDTHGQIIGLSQMINDVTQNLLTEASYAPFGLAKSLTLGNGKTTVKKHNLNGQLKSIDVNDIYQTSLTYDGDSNITGLDNTLTPTSNQGYTYDDLDRVTDATGGYGTLGYSYDSASNRITKKDITQTASYTYIAESNQLASPYIHDANGNRTKDSKRTYSYGINNRLTEVINDESGIKTTYLYNGLGQRVKKSNVFGDIYFIYDEQGLLIAEANEKASITKEYVYFEGKPLVMLVGKE